MLPYFYHMYMALLAGGQLIRAIVRKTLLLFGSEGTRALELPGDAKARRRPSPRPPAAAVGASTPHLIPVCARRNSAAPFARAWISWAWA